MKQRIRYLTINTDASYNDKTGAAGFAYWIVADIPNQERPSRFFGVGRGRQADVNESELTAILRAVRRVKAERVWRYADRIVFNTDSMKAIELLSRLKKRVPLGSHTPKRLRAVANAVWDIVKEWKKSVDFRHVRAHTDKDDKRSYVNRWCDVESRRARRLEDARVHAFRAKMKERKQNEASLERTESLGSGDPGHSLGDGDIIGGRSGADIGGGGGLGDNSVRPDHLVVSTVF